MPHKTHKFHTELLDPWPEEGFILQVQAGQYVLGAGPLARSTTPDPHKWSLFHPPFFTRTRKAGSQTDRQRVLPRSIGCDSEPSCTRKAGSHTACKAGSHTTHHGAYWFIPSYTAELSHKELVSLFLQDAALENFSSNKKEMQQPALNHSVLQGTTLENLSSNKKEMKWQAPSFSVFQSCFAQTLQEIHQGQLKKAVPVFFETTRFTANIKALLYRLLTTHANQGMAYAFWSKTKTIMGRTPEYLFQKSALNVHTHALAGTARDLRHNLLSDPKERQEHEWVVRGIKNSLSTLGEISLLGPYIYSLGPIRHLRTDCTLKLKHDISFQKLCELLHPTPALGGFPKKQALDLLMKWEQKTQFMEDPEGVKGWTSPRYSFGAPFGVALRDKAFCLVAIRNAQFINGKVFVGSGCGLVQNSHLTTEWQELKQKREFIKQILFG